MEIGKVDYFIENEELKMPNRKAKDRKRKRRKLNELLKRQGRTANQVRRKREKDNDNN